MTKKIFILWSGGLDSTYLVDYALKQGYEVTTGYIELENNKEKVKRELSARTKMIDEYFKHYNFKDLGVIYKCLITTHNNENIRLHYPIQFMNIIHVMPKCDEVWIGYVLNDDAISFLDEIRTCWNGYSGLVDKLPKLEFPITKCFKVDIYNELRQELKDNITWCESPEDVSNCTTCVPCKKMNYLGLGIKNILKNNDETICCEKEEIQLELTI